MSGRTVIPLVLGLGMGVFAIKMFVDVLKKAKGANSAETTEVVCARLDIGPTIEITDAMVESVTVAKSLVPKMAFGDMKEVIGRVTTQTIPKGIPVVPSLLAPKGTPAGMAARIPDGYRAVAVKVDEEVGVAGWLKPGSRVDVVAVMTNRESSKNETTSRVILQNVEILAVGQDIGNSGDTAAALSKSVTLLVKPDAVPKLSLAATKGTLRLAMRGQDDEKSNQAKSTTDNDLMGIEDGGAKKPSSSFLAGLFGNQPKNTPQATDKAKVPVREQAPPPQLVVVKPTWAVDVLAGSQTYQVVFDGQLRDAHRVTGTPDRGSGTPKGSARPAAAGMLSPAGR